MLFCGGIELSFRAIILRIYLTILYLDTTEIDTVRIRNVSDIRSEERQQLTVNLFKKTIGLLLTVRDNILY